MKNKQTRMVLLAVALTGTFLNYMPQGHAEMNESLQKMKSLFTRPKTIPYPEDNPYSKEKELLGKMLYFDPRVSSSKVMSCATCHNPSFGWGDHLEKAVGHGHKVLGRRSPTILNLAWAPRLFWDGRAASLEEQALGPIFSDGEMGGNAKALVETIKSYKEYQTLFKKVFPNEEISETNIAKAIATFERGVVSGIAPFDKWIQGDQKAISLPAQRGFKTFNTKANCVACHAGWSFTDHSFRDIGMNDEDIGRSKLLPNLPTMVHAFKTPTLRNVTQRAPYMHNGSEQTLEDVIEFYNKGGKVSRPSVASEIKPLGLTPSEKADLLEFLKTLTSNDEPIDIPILPVTRVSQ